MRKTNFISERATLLLAMSVFLGTPAIAQQDFSAVEIKAVAVAGGVSMLTGAGGNMGVSTGSDGVFLIDDQFAPLTEKIVKAIGTLAGKDVPVRFVLNTHLHGDHTGGNENLGKSGSVIVAHDNVRKRMSVEQFSEFFKRSTPPAPKAALPIVTFSSDLTFHMNDDEIHVFHVDPAHTDGDAVVHFKNANVFHMGDLFFSGTYPYVDISAGGSVIGILSAAERVLALANENSRIIPGHGPLSGRKELLEYRDMLTTSIDRIRPFVTSGKSLEEIKAAEPLKDLDGTWGNGFIKGEQYIEFVYKSLSK